MLPRPPTAPDVSGCASSASSTATTQECTSESLPCTSRTSLVDTEYSSEEVTARTDSSSCAPLPTEASAAETLLLTPVLSSRTMQASGVSQRGGVQGSFSHLQGLLHRLDCYAPVHAAGLKRASALRLNDI
jgi:hypothetical protein